MKRAQSSSAMCPLDSVSELISSTVHLLIILQFVRRVDVDVHFVESKKETRN